MQHNPVVVDPGQVIGCRQLYRSGEELFGLPPIESLPVKQVADQRKESGARGKPREKGGQLQERRQLLRKEVGSDSETRGVIPVEELPNVQPRDRGVRYKREAHANENKSEDGAKRHFLWAPFVVGW